MRLAAEPRNDDTGAGSYALTETQTGPSPDSPAQPSFVQSLGATVGTLALLQPGMMPAEPNSLAPNEFMAVATPARVGDLVAARQAPFTQTWHRAWIVRVATRRNREMHTVQWEDGSTTPDAPLSRLRSVKPPDGPPDVETTAACPPPALPAGSSTQNDVLRTTDAEPGDAAYHGFDGASFLASLPDGDLRVTGAPSVYAPPPPDDGTWHPLVHDLAPIVIEALVNLELLFDAKRHSTGVAPWVVQMAWHGTWNGGQLGQGRSVEASTGGGEPTLQGNETPCTTDA